MLPLPSLPTPAPAPPNVLPLPGLASARPSRLEPTARAARCRAARAFLGSRAHAGSAACAVRDARFWAASAKGVAANLDALATGKPLSGVVRNASH